MEEECHKDGGVHKRIFRANSHPDISDKLEKDEPNNQWDWKLWPDTVLVVIIFILILYMYYENP